MARKIRLLLIDDHSLFRESLGRLLRDERDLELVADCPSVETARTALAQEIDVILLDFDLGEQSSLAFIEEVQSAGFKGKILMVTAGMRTEDTVRALQLGAAGVFPKHSSPKDLVRAIHTVLRGETWLESSNMQTLLTAVKRSQSESSPSVTFTERERRVLDGVFEGHANKEIAAKLEISEGYVKAILQQLFAKTGVRTRAQLVRIALENRREYGLTGE